jgi:hypothetical protein
VTDPLILTQHPLHTGHIEGKARPMSSPEVRERVRELKAAAVGARMPRAAPLLAAAAAAAAAGRASETIFWIRSCIGPFWGSQMLVKHCPRSL